MLALLRFSAFILASVLFFAFTSYLNWAYFLDIYLHRFYNDVTNFKKYDYIVVGAGSAGAVLSTRLANAGHDTLLVEAGGVAPPFIDIPLVTPMIQKSPYDWQYKTVPQQHACKGLIHNQSVWPMGKILGGTSRLNYMVYIRGHPLDYDKWFPDFVEPISEKNGPMSISGPMWKTDFADAVLKAVEEVGEHVGNINKDSDTGFMKVQLSMSNGRRWSADKLLHENATDKLTVITHAHVQKVLIESNKATGIEFVRFNEQFTALARKGVILSAGAVGSPKLLMLSGIGPKKHLQNLKIKVIRDLPVGQNLIDHVLTGIDLITLNASLALSMTNALHPVSALDYFLFQEGPWTSSGIEAVGTFHSSLQNNKSIIPDLQIMVFPLGASQDNGIVLKKAMGISDEIYNEYFAPLVYKNAVTIAPVLLHPKSTGEIKLRSSDPMDKPLINPRYLSNKNDVVTLINGLQFVEKLVETASMKAIGATMYKKKFPGCEDKVFGSTEYWECYVRHLTLTSYHPAGTCRLGDVVDASFKVYGLTNLYVVDASVLPAMPSGNINAAVIMLAEKAARMIMQDTKIQVNGTKSYKVHSYCLLFNVCDNICGSI